VTDAEAAAEKLRREAEQGKTAPKAVDSSSQKGGGQTKEQTSAVPQAEREFWLPVDSQSGDEHGRLADPGFLEANFSKKAEMKYCNTNRRF
jgi:hypothetical protein